MDSAKSPSGTSRSSSGFSSSPCGHIAKGLSMGSREHLDRTARTGHITRTQGKLGDGRWSRNGRLVPRGDEQQETMVLAERSSRSSKPAQVFNACCSRRRQSPACRRHDLGSRTLVAAQCPPLMSFTGPGVLKLTFWPRRMHTAHQARCISQCPLRGYDVSGFMAQSHVRTQAAHSNGRRRLVAHCCPQNSRDVVTARSRTA